MQEKRKALLDARLAKVRQRKLKKLQEEGGVSGEDSSAGLGATNLTDFELDKKGSTDDRGGVLACVCVCACVRWGVWNDYPILLKKYLGK